VDAPRKKQEDDVPPRKRLKKGQKNGQKRMACVGGVYLFQIAMQCQIIDEVLDYSKDMSAGLPSFLTASKSLPQAFELTRLAALGYADERALPRTGDVFLLEFTLQRVRRGHLPNTSCHRKMPAEVSLCPKSNFAAN
jgi:hypothetical protein